MDQVIDILKAIFAVIGTIVLAVFAKRYSDLKKEAAFGKKLEVENEILKTTHANDALSGDELMERENRRFWSRLYARKRRDH
jgi:hypothetical protein